MSTIEINNFSGKLTREIHGDINSGLIPFASSNLSGGVYPFSNISYPSQLSFIEDKVSINPGQFSAPIIHFANASNPAVGTLSCSFGVGLTGNFYIINQAAGNPDGDSRGLFNNAVGHNIYYGGGLVLGNLTSTTTSAVAYVGHDDGIQVSSDLGLLTATWSGIGIGTFVANVPRPLQMFLGNLYAGNGNNIAEIILGNTVSTYNKLSPSLPASYCIRDLKVSNDGNYLVIISSFINDTTNSLKIDGTTGTLGSQNLFGCIDSVVAFWNGIDQGYSSLKYYKGINISSIIVSNTETLLFGKDDEGVGIWDLGGNKIYSIPETSNLSSPYPPNPGSIFVLGKKIFFLIKYLQTTCIFCLDREDNSLYLLGTHGTIGDNVVGSITIPSVHATNRAFTDLSRTKIYFSNSNIPISTASNNFVFYQHLQNYGGNVYAGSYSTQIQKFNKKITIKEVRIYCLPTSANTSFSLSILGSNNAPVTGNSTFTYTYTAGSDLTKGQGPMDLIKFKPQLKDLQSMGINITNIGTASPFINKIEVDYEEVPSPKTNG